MALTMGCQRSTTNGTSYVTICSAPASATKRVLAAVNIYNRDSATHNVEIFMYDTTTYYPMHKEQVSAGAHCNPATFANTRHTLDATNITLVARLDATASTNATCVVSYQDQSV